MIVVCDIETNRLYNPDHIWCIVCHDVGTGKVDIFREVTTNEKEKERFIDYATQVKRWVGHNFQNFDCNNINNLVAGNLISPDTVVDTLVVSRLVDYERKKHSLESFGEEFGLEKITHVDYTHYNQELEQRCIRDVEINVKLYEKFKKYINSPKWSAAIELEHQINKLTDEMQKVGFYFNKDEAVKLMHDIEGQLAVIDKDISDAFPPKLKPVREINPTMTKHGTLHRKDFKWVKDGDLTPFNADAPFTLCEWTEFNPNSNPQIIEILNTAGWKPFEKTEGHKDLEREVNRRKWDKSRKGRATLDKESQRVDTEKLEKFRKVGWKVNEANLATLPEDAPQPARTLAKRILLESRRRTLKEWVELTHPDTGRIHGVRRHIGAWTHRMSHDSPNTANIPREDKLYGGEFRSLWCAPEDRYLIGVDAEGIQLRVFAHYVDNEELTHSLVSGDKAKGTDPHTLNKNIMGYMCADRDVAKTYIYAMFLGASHTKLREILSCSSHEEALAFDNIMAAYPGLVVLRETIIPKDARRGYFEGFDGRYVKIPGETQKDREHLAMSGYLQCGEAIIVKKASVKVKSFLDTDYPNAYIVNIVHDELIIEAPKDYKQALEIAERTAATFGEVSTELNLRCPMAGSILNAHKEIAIGSNWLQTH